MALSKRKCTRQWRCASIAGCTALFLFFGATLFAQPSGRAVSGLRRSILRNGPLWVSQAAWDSREERLIVPDPGSARIAVYDRAGQLVRRIARPGLGPLEFEKPNLSFRIGQRFLVGASPYRWIWLNDHLEPESGWDLEWEEREGAYARLAPYDVVVGERELVAVGAVQRHDGEWSEWGVFAVPLHKPSAVRQVATVGKDADERGFYLSPPSNLAVCGGRAYLLRTGPNLFIEEITSHRRLNSFPAAFRARPPLPPVAMETYVSRQAALRHIASADGLFSSDDRWLLLLAHRARPAGGVQWLVYPIDAKNDELAAPVELPTSAADIVFVPGRLRWAVFEKGPLRELGVQPLTALLTFDRPPFGGTKRTGSKSSR
jgi:hypothetical protein